MATTITKTSSTTTSLTVHAQSNYYDGNLFDFYLGGSYVGRITSNSFINGGYYYADYTFYGLQCGTTYSIGVDVGNYILGTVEMGNANLATSSCPTPPPSPTIGTPSVNGKDVTISVGVPSGATVKSSCNNSGLQMDDVFPSSGTWSHTMANYSTTYSATFWSEKDGLSSGTVQRTFTTGSDPGGGGDPTNPSTPTSITATPTSNSVTISYSEGSGSSSNISTEYDVWVTSDSGGSHYQGNMSSPPITITGLAYSTNYTYKLRSYDVTNDLYSDWTTTHTFTTGSSGSGLGITSIGLNQGNARSVTINFSKGTWSYFWWMYPSRDNYLATEGHATTSPLLISDSWASMECQLLYGGTNNTSSQPSDVYETYVYTYCLTPTKPTLVSVTPNSITVSAGDYSPSTANWGSLDGIEIRMTRPDGIKILQNVASYANYNADQAVTTFYNLQPNTNYIFDNKALWQSPAGNRDSNRSGTLNVTTLPATRPANFSWSIPIESGVTSSKDLPYTDWDNFTDRINDFREYMQLTPYSFIPASSGGKLTARMFNEAINTINQMSPSVSPPTTIADPQPIKLSDRDRTTAERLNLIVTSLNSIT